MEESIKYTIKYLLNDGLLSCFVNSIVLNNRLDRICRELDSLGFEPNIFPNFTICGSNDKKDNTLLPRRRKGCRERRSLVKTRDDRYLTEEVGLGSMKASAPPTYSCRGRACKRAATYDSPSNEKIDRTERMESCWNREDSQDTFCSNDLEKLFDEGREKEGSSLLEPTKRLSNEQGTIKRSTLKLIIRKVRSWDRSCSISLKPVRSCSLSLPCKAHNVTKEIFQADPGLHESCLIVMRRKFETGISNLCSCLNDVLEKLNDKIINNLRLVLEIRPGYINFKLIGKEDGESRSCLFTDRVPICQSVHKHDTSRVIENSIGSNEVSSFNEFYDTFNDAVASGEAKNIDEGNCKKLRFSSSALCTKTSMNEVEQTLDGKIDMDEEQKTQLLLDFSVTGRTEKEEIVSTSAARINDDTFMSKKENEDVFEIISSKLEINCPCKKSVDDLMRCSVMEENVSSSAARINDDSVVLKEVSSKIDVNFQYRENDDESLTYPKIEKQFKTNEEIKLDPTVECTCCSSCGIPIVSSNIDEEMNIPNNKNEILDSMKHLIIEIVEEIVTMNATGNILTTDGLTNEDNSNLIKEENEESLSCDCSMSLDSLITRKTLHQNEINSDCDSRCSCRSKVASSISSSSLDRKSNEDFLSNGVLQNEAKLPSSIPSEIKKIDVSRTRNNFVISKNEDEMVCPKYEDNKIVYNRKDLISLSIQTSRTRTSSKFANAESWSQKFDEEIIQKERKREKPVKIWKSHKKVSSNRRPMQILSKDNLQRSFLPTEKRSICTCDISKCSGHRGRRRFKDDSWTSRIKKYILFRRSNFVSGSFCESFYSSRRSIGRLRNLVRSKLRRFMSSDGKNGIDRSKMNFPMYERKNEIKKSHLFYGERVKNCDDSFESETFRTIYRKRRNVEKTMPQNSFDFFTASTRHNFSIETDKKRIPTKNFIYNLQACHDINRYSNEKRSMTSSYSRIDEESTNRRDNLISTSSSSKPLVRRKVEYGKAREKSRNTGRTFEFVLDKRFWEEITDHSTILDDYEKSICDLGLDFRSKLEQYVALCKNIKYSLIGSTKGNNTTSYK